MEQRSIWDQIAARVRPSGALVAMENPSTIVWMGIAWTLGVVPNAVAQAALYFWFVEPVTAWLWIAYGFGSIVGWFLFSTTGSVRGTFLLMLGLSMATVTAVHVTMGGYANSGAVLMWGIALATISVLILERREALAVGSIIAVIAVVLAFLEQTLQASRPPPDPTLPAVMFTYTLVAVIVMMVPVMALLMGRLSLEREQAERLLLNVLPREVASELKETGATSTRRFESISVLFADIVGFTPLTAGMQPEEMVDQLNEVFTRFDTLSARHGCEKIRTIGDAYMVASGVPTQRADHAHAIASLALEMLEYAKTTTLSFRLGISSGPAVAGVVGTSKFQYDIWGDTVNTASRMESHGTTDRIQIAEGTYQLVKDHFETTLRGPIEVKGKGSLPTWYLDGVTDPPTRT
ncbi:MAG: adenylate/guanylate cyclase domain-containing protein [Acidimicrobiia bacterium]